MVYVQYIDHRLGFASHHKVYIRPFLVLLAFEPLLHLGITLPLEIYIYLSPKVHCLLRSEPTSMSSTEFPQAYRARMWHCKMSLTAFSSVPSACTPQAIYLLLYKRSQDVFFSVRMVQGNSNNVDVSVINRARVTC